MGTTLTGTTPQDTYDSLIKVTDNGPISGTAKFLSDGLGNDSVLALSNARVGVGTITPQAPLEVKGSLGIRVDEAGTGSNVLTLRSDFAGAGPAVNVTSNSPLLFLTNNSEKLRITSTGNVGIGTSAPAHLLDIQSTSATLRIRNTTPVNAGGTSRILFEGLNDFSGVSQAFINSIQAGNSGVTQLAFGTSGVGDATATERFRVTNNGVTFNGDTAAANALDDYEEGTWTIGVSFGGASVGVTTNLNAGAYTKVGNKVTVTGFLQLSSKGSSTGVAKITGLPFTLPANLNRLSAPSLWFNNITFANQFQGYCDQNSTNIDLYETTEAGVATALANADFANNSEIMLSATYFV